MNNKHNSRGRYAKKWSKRAFIAGALVCAGILGLGFYGDYWSGRELHAIKESVVPVAHADITDEAKAVKTIAQLKEEMIGKIWNAESQKYTPKSGELFVTYDPTDAMKESGICTKVGGKRLIDCDSYGPMQEKIGTIQNFWPQMYNGETISQLEALAITQDVEKAKKFFLDCAIKVPTCVFHWTYAKNNPDWFNIVIPIIRSAEN